MHLLTYKIVLVIFELNEIISNMKITIWETIKTESKENRNGRTYITKCVFVNPKKTIFEKKKYSHKQHLWNILRYIQNYLFLIKIQGIKYFKMDENLLYYSFRS